MYITKDCSGPFAPLPWTSYFTLRVDGQSVIAGDSGAGFSTLAYDTGATQMMEWNWISNTGAIQVNMFVSLQRDKVRFQYTLTNLDTVNHQVGGRWMVAPSFSRVENFPFRVPDRPEVKRETELIGTDAPGQWYAVDSVQNPSAVLYCDWDTQEASTSDKFGLLRGQLAERPDRVQFQTWYQLYLAPWQDPGQGIVPNFDFTEAVWGGGAACYWEPIQLAPGKSRLFVVYYGISPGDSDSTHPYIFATHSPPSLHYVAGDNPKTDDKVETTWLSPSEFGIHAYVYNRALFDEQALQYLNTRVNLTLHEGLQLAAGETATKVIPLIDPNKEGHVEWRVKPTATKWGKVNYSVSVTPGTGIPVPKTIFRSINIPATDYVTLGTGFQMASVPFEMSIPDSSSFTFPPDSIKFFAYNPDFARYEVPLVLKQGEGYFLRSSATQTGTVTGVTATSGQFRNTFQYQLKEGWNLIGNPYLYSIALGKMRVIFDPLIGAVTLKEAEKAGYLRRVLFYYDRDAENEFGGRGAYVFSDADSYQLDAWKAYWIKCDRPCVLVFPPIDLTLAGFGNIDDQKGKSRNKPDGNRALRGTEGWVLNLKVRTEKSADPYNFVGLARDASDGYDGRDIPKAPAFPGLVSLRIDRQSWPGSGRGAYAQDIQALTNRTKTWDIVVDSPTDSGEVEIAWPEINRTVPKGWRLTLVDQESGNRVYMRSSTSYRFRPTGETRRFRLTAEPGSAGSLRVQNVFMSSGRGLGSATINYNLSSSADVEVKIVNLAGKTVRRLGGRAAGSAGLNQIVWDLRTDAGSRAPRGTYLVEVTARNQEGAVSKGIAQAVVR
jgi:hypothetical protein